MIRTQIYLDDSQKDRLERLSRQKKRPMAELIREAVEDYLAVTRPEAGVESLKKAFGIWSDCKETGKDYVDRIRREWS
jgi:predicted transcriptional regulator